MSGGLISCGPDTAELFQRAAVYVDRILKGERPGDLPVQAPVKFEMAVNLKTAKSLAAHLVARSTAQSAEASLAFPIARSKPAPPHVTRQGIVAPALFPVSRLLPQGAEGAKTAYISRPPPPVPPFP
jgi:ABC transporter substrate binding protein